MSGPPDGSEGLARLRVLVADDSPDGRLLIGSFLKRSVARVDFAENGEAAVECVTGTRYDVVLMDWQMPEMSGIEATAQIRALDGEPCAMVPIIAMTANAMRGDREKCPAAGMNDYVSKPIDQGLLAQTLLRWVA